jgi:site-specific recombinase XerD
VQEIIAVMHPAGENPEGVRLRGVIVVLWRARLRISEALALAESDLRQLAHATGVRRRLAAHQLKRAHAVEMSREGIPLVVIQRRLGHDDLGITSA